MFVQINVTPDDIKQGLEAQRWGYGSYVATKMCPLARATRRVIPKAQTSNLYITTTPGCYQPIRLPKRAKQFTIAFDHHEPVQPFSFYVWRDTRDYAA